MSPDKGNDPAAAKSEEARPATELDDLHHLLLKSVFPKIGLLNTKSGRWSIRPSYALTSGRMNLGDRAELGVKCLNFTMRDDGTIAVIEDNINDSNISIELTNSSLFQISPSLSLFPDDQEYADKQGELFRALAEADKDSKTAFLDNETVKPDVSRELKLDTTEVEKIKKAALYLLWKEMIDLPDVHLSYIHDAVSGALKKDAGN